MEARKLLKRYAAGERNFQGVNLRGQSFIGQNLSGANFSQADIRSTNFTDTNLKGANFTGAKCGLQRRWAILIVAISWGLSWLSGRLVGLSVVFLSSLFNVSSGTFSVRNYLDNPISFLLMFSIVGTAIVTVALLGGIANAIGVATSMALASQLLASISITISIIVTWKVVAGSTLAQATILTIILTEIYILLSAYVGWTSITLEKKYFFIRPLSIFLTTWKGTNFLRAKLIDVNLSNAVVENTNFRAANITRTFWFHAKKIALIRPGNTYLQNKKVRQLVTTIEGQNQNFNRLDLRGVNLQGANLENASLIDADFYQANLQEANLSGAILVRANLEQADLRSANLTGSCIQDWVITKSTELDGIICDYVYLKWINGDKRDQMPPRGKFKADGFVTFVRYILETVELYYEKDINPRLALNVLQKMSKDYGEPLEILALGKKGDRVFIQVKVSENIIRENFKEDYYSRYDSDLKLWSGNIHQLPPAVNNFIEKRINEIASEKTDDFVFVNATYAEGNYTEIYQGEVSINGDRNIKVNNGNYNENIEGNYIEQSGNFGIGHMSGGKIQESAKVAGVINEEEQQNLAKAAAEIQQLLDRLSQTNPTITTSEKLAVVNEVAEQIESNPKLKARMINALKSGGVEAFKEAIDHPLVSILMATIEGWREIEVN